MFIILSFRNLFRNVRRTCAVLLTIALGSGALICYDGFNSGLLERYREGTIHSHYGNGQIYVKGYREKIHDQPWQYWIKDWGALKELLIQQDSVENVFPRLGFSGLLSNGKKTVSGQGLGIDGVAESSFFYKLNIVEGENLTSQQNGIILGKGLATALDVAPGDEIAVHTHSIEGKMNQIYLKVVGIFYTGSHDFDSRVFRIPLEQAQTLLKTQDIETLSVGLNNPSDWNNISKLVLEKHSDYEPISFEELDAIFYKHSVEWLRAQFRVVQGIILTVVVLGIFNSVSTSILERKQEIGNLRANGESMIDIIKMTLLEGAFLGMLGSTLGLLASFLIVHLFLSDGFLMPPGPGLTKEIRAFIYLQGSMIWKTTLLCTFAAVLATFFASFRVVKLPVAKALYG
ncbi:MAG: ABC transporter permease [Chlamydiales bacterium]